ncbi:hypothetical protein MTP03_37290 [Tsukamurella sp. PLM1]|nr:hypothetical protein MTP03_37290 [Tsukamurella sp. PLM1]
MQLLPRLQVLTQQAERHLCHRGGIARVAPGPGCRGGVRLAAGEPDGEVGERQRPGPDHVERRRVHHARTGDTVEHPALQHEHLAAPGLLRGRAVHLDGDPELVRDGRERDPGAEARGRDDVVPTGVADAGKRVVLGEDRDAQGPDPARPTNAVGRSAMPRSTVNPWPANASATRPAAKCSSNASSGRACTA